MDLVDEIYLQIGEVVRSKRELSGLAQDELAALVGLTRTSITNIEKGRQRIQVHTMCAIADVLKTSPCEFLPHPETPTFSEIDVRLPGDLQPKERVWVRSVLTSRKKESSQNTKTSSKVKLGMRPAEIL